jgi:hypothetical protein
MDIPAGDELGRWLASGSRYGERCGSLVTAQADRRTCEILLEMRVEEVPGIGSMAGQRCRSPRPARVSVDCAARPGPPWPTRTVSWLYGALGDYGNSIGRPISCLAVSWFVGLLFIVYTGAKLAQPDAMYRNWRSILVGSSFCAQFLRSALLSIEPILPLGLIRREPLVEAATPFLASIQAAQSYISAVLFFLLAVAIRRKFRISAGSS